MIAPTETSEAVSSSITRAVVPVAGQGSRLRPLTHLLPKELLPVGRKLVLDYVMEELHAAGIREALFVISPRKPQIRTYLEEIVGASTGLHFAFAVQEEPKGSGDALLYAAEWVGAQPFVVAFGDCILDSSPVGAPLKRLIQAFEQHQVEAAVLVEEVERERLSRYGVVAPVETVSQATPFLIHDIIEKPGVDAAPSSFVVAARWILKPTIFEAIRRSSPDPRGEWNIPDALHHLLGSQPRAVAVPLLEGEARRDIGSWGSFLMETVRSAMNDPEYGAQIRRVAAKELTRFSDSGIVVGK
ncbi:UDP-glucose pyrophosphorylase [Chthonomonas calidirosea]|uniref:UTP--glucose-1-phosphate uridylyltransferase n=1 Tax=Chthonomonas calidirosea (strain DSM 23976 / ICMP 18418 / T49) TaxID=1303518 RepID=S0EYU9_CHTCT|nr:sugar phosphate nucleotidyltransferase [Chthonomonas calidirosea]CCW35716.1 UDP-glucose pyrophosphorylase [Chthonomonas calidirosea T49]CEK19449.1 UDP-glucose pyrophosphorylase [Chthonomonas calidirosea]